jgi:hypothetical protein
MAIKRTRSSILTNKSRIPTSGSPNNGSFDVWTAAVGEVRNIYTTANVGKRFNSSTGQYFREVVFLPSSRTDTSIKTWNRPKNVKWVELLVVGGGGSGGTGRAAQGGSASGGGGAGEVFYGRVYVGDYDVWYIKCGLGSGRPSLTTNSSNFNSWGKPGTMSIFSPLPIIWNFAYETAADGLQDNANLTDTRPASLKGNSTTARAVRGATFHGIRCSGGGGGGHPAGGVGQPGGCEGGGSRGRRQKLLSNGDGNLGNNNFARDSVFYGKGFYGGLGAATSDASIQWPQAGAGGGGGVSSRGISGTFSGGGTGGNGVTLMGRSVGGGGGGGRYNGSPGSGGLGGGGTGGRNGVNPTDGVNGTGGGGGGGVPGNGGRGGHGTVVIRYWV